MSIDSDLNQPDQYNHVRDASIRGAGAGVAAFISQFAIRACATVVLARLLVPEDFGLVALSGIVLNLFIRVADLGLTTAATQRYNVDSVELSTSFFFNVVGGIFLAGLMMATAPLYFVVYLSVHVTLPGGVDLIRKGTNTLRSVMGRRD